MSKFKKYDVSTNAKMPGVQTSKYQIYVPLLCKTNLVRVPTTVQRMKSFQVFGLELWPLIILQVSRDSLIPMPLAETVCIKKRGRSSTP